MKLLRSFALAMVLAGTASADTPKDSPKPSPSPVEKKAPEKTPAKTEPAKTELDPAQAEKFLAFYNKFVDMVVASGGDCPKLTKDTNALIDANVDLIKKVKEAKAAKKELPAAVKEKMMARLKEMGPTLQKCMQDPAFQAVMKRMQDQSSPPPAAKEPPKDTKPSPSPTPTKTAPKADAKPATK